MQALKANSQLPANPGDALAPTDWRAHLIWVLIANLAQAGGVFLTLLLLSRLRGLAVAGDFAYAQAIATPLYQLLGLQLKAQILTHSQEELRMDSASAVRCASTGVGGLLAFGIAIFIHPLAGMLLGAKLAESWAEMFQANFQRQGLPFKAAWNAMLRSSFMIGAILLSPSLELGIGLYFILSLTLLCACEMDRSGLNLDFQRQSMSPLIRRGLLLGFVMFLQSVQVSIPRIVLERESNAESLGVFATLCVILQSGNLMVSSYGQSALPRLSTLTAGEMLRFIAKPGAWALALAIPLILACPWILRLMRLESAPGSAATLCALSLAQIMIWPATVVGYALTARRLYQEQIWITILLNIVAGLGSWLLIPGHGAAGAATALGITAFAMLLASAYVLRGSHDNANDLNQLSERLVRLGAQG